MDLARISLAASLRFDWDDCMALRMTGESRRATVSVASANSPGRSVVVTSSLILRIRWPVRLSLTVPMVTSMSVAMNASGEIPMSKTTLLNTDSAESPCIVPMMALPALPALMLW